MQIDHSWPLLRSGIVAGKTEGRRIVLDCPVDYGFSGSLVVEVDETHATTTRYRGVGLVSQWIPVVDELWSTRLKSRVATERENSGFSLVVPMDAVFDLIGA